MYQYNPQFKKKKEKFISLAMAILGVVMYASSQIPNAPFPGLIQILGICALAGSILLISMCVLRSYSYELVRGEGEATDFVITEHYSRRKTVVCRIGLSDVVAVTPYDPNWKKEKNTVYSYTGVLFDEKRYLLEVQAHGEHFFIVICADETLLSYLPVR
jgi:hypothetical protein